MRVYQLRFMRTLKAKALEKAARFPKLLDPARIRRARGIVEFDDCVTAPLYELPSAAEYYAWASSGTRLASVRTPSLLISAEDDPLAPASHLPALDNEALHRCITPAGGHVGFVSGSLWSPSFWAEEQAFRFFDLKAP